MQQVMGELAPADFTDEALGRLGRTGAVHDRIADGGETLTRAQLAEMQVRRKARTCGLVGAVATVVIAADPVTAEFREPRVGSVFPRLPVPGEGAVPAERRQQVQLRQRNAARRVFRALQPAGSRKRRGLRVELRLAGPPERREDPVGASRAVRIAQGSYSRAALKLSHVMPWARSAVCNSLSRATQAGS